MMLIKFLLVGTLNTLVGLGAIYFAMYFLSLDNITANAFGYIIGILLGFALNKRWTFANRDGITATLIRYFIVIAVAYAVNLTVVLSTHLYLELNQYLAQATGIIPYTIIAFFGSRYYAFKNNGYSNTADINQPTSFNDTETMGVAKL
ncbi:GtrA family protein, partial [Methylomagnum sp.]